MLQGGRNSSRAVATMNNGHARQGRGAHRASSDRLNANPRNRLLKTKTSQFVTIKINGLQAKLKTETRPPIRQKASSDNPSVGGHVAKKLGDGLMAPSAIRWRMRTTPSAPRGRRCRSNVPSGKPQ